MGGIWSAAAALGCLGFLAILVLAQVARQIRRLPVRPAAVRLCQSSDLPEHLSAMFRAAEQDLQRLGFRFSHCEQAGSPFRVGDATVWTQVWVNDQEHCTASIVPSDVPDVYFPCHVAFSTRYGDGSTLLTVNGQAHRFVPGIPGLLLVDAWAPDVETHWQVHR
jgi:hypothetical protein